MDPVNENGNGRGQDIGKADCWVTPDGQIWNTGGYEVAEGIRAEKSLKVAVARDMFRNENLARVSERARLLYLYLALNCDSLGTTWQSPARLRAEAFPYENPDFDVVECLAELEVAGLAAVKFLAGRFMVIAEYDAPLPTPPMPEDSFALYQAISNAKDRITELLKRQVKAAEKEASSEFDMRLRRDDVPAIKADGGGSVNLGMITEPQEPLPEQAREPDGDAKAASAARVEKINELRARLFGGDGEDKDAGTEAPEKGEDRPEPPDDEPEPDGGGPGNGDDSESEAEDDAGCPEEEMPPLFPDPAEDYDYPELPEPPDDPGEDRMTEPDSDDPRENGHCGPEDIGEDGPPDDEPDIPREAEVPEPMIEADPETDMQYAEEMAGIAEAAREAAESDAAVADEIAAPEEPGGGGDNAVNAGAALSVATIDDADEVTDGVTLKTVIALYHEMLPGLPHIVKVGETLKTKFKRCLDRNKDSRELAFWKDYFGKVGESDFLMGKTKTKSMFRADLRWLMGPENMDKTYYEGRYQNIEKNAESAFERPLRPESMEVVERYGDIIERHFGKSGTGQ